MRWNVNRKHARRSWRNACAGDDQLRVEVDSFLSRGAGTDGFIESPAIELAAKGWPKIRRIAKRQL